MRRDLFLCVLFFTVMGSWAQTTVSIGGLDTSTTTYSPSVTGATFSNASRGSGVGSASASGSMSGNGFNTASPEASYTAAKYYTFNITAASTHNVTLTSFTWLTTLSGTASGTAFTIKYINNNGTLTNFGTASQSNSSTNTFTGSVVIAAGTTLRLYLIPSGANAATGTVRFRNTSSFVVNAVSAVSAPTVSAVTDVTDITTNNASATGTVSATGGAALSAKGLVWTTSSTTNPVLSTNNFSKLTGGTDVSTFAANFSYVNVTTTNLLSNTQYFYRAYATNSAGTGYSSSKLSFYTLALTPATPSVNNASITTLDVNVVSGGNNTATTYAIQEVGGKYVQADGSLGDTEVWQTLAAWGTETVTGLTAGTTYSFAVKARNGANVETAFSSSATGTTLNANAPSLVLENASLNFDSFCINTTTVSNFTFSSTNLVGGIIEIKAVNGYSYSLTEAGVFTPTLDIEDYNGSITTVYVKFAPTAVQSYNGTIVIDALNADAELAQLNVPVLGSGENNPGTVTTVAVTASTITSVSGILSATATTGGCSVFSEYGFDYATTSAAITGGTATRVQTTDVSGTTFTKELTGLLPSTVYYYRAYAIDGTGTVYATGTAIRSFTTSAIATPVTIAATNVEQTSFQANWNTVEAAAGYRLDVSTNPDFGTATFATDLIFSEYVEGTSNNKALEIYNGTGATVNLSAYSIKQQLNGSGDFGDGNEYTLPLPNFNLQHGQTYVIASDGASGISSTKNLILNYNTLPGGRVIHYNGNDPIALYKNNVQIDLIEGGEDVTLVRKADVLAPSTSYNASQWTSYANNTYTYLGSHTMNTTFIPSFVTGYNNLDVSNVISYDVTNLTPFTTYYYRVRAYSGSNATANSNVTSVTTKVGALTWVIPSGQTAAQWTPATYPNGTATVVNATTDVTINADYNTAVNGTFTAGKLTLKNGKTITVATGTTLTLNTIVNEAGADKFVVEDNGALLQSANVQNTSNITVHKKSNPLFRLDYTLWSSPVKGQNLLSFSPNTAANRFYEYRYASNGTEFIEGYWSVTPGDNTFDAAKGYLIRMPNADGRGGYNGGDTSFAFDGTFAGVPNNGDVTIALSTQNNRFTAVGNPYPSPISVAKFFAENEDKLQLGTGLYLWRKRNGDQSSSYATLTKAGYTVNPDDASTVTLGNFYQGNDAEAGNWLISQGQGFIVKTAEGLTAPQLKFTNSMRSASPGASQGFFRTAQGSVASKLWLNIKSQSGTASQAMVAYMHQGTTGLDYGYDGLKLTDSNTLSLYSIAENKQLAIQARPEFNASDVVLMGFTAATAGQFTISLDHVEGVFTQGQVIYLKDNAEGIIRNISDRDYTFTTEAGTFENRFEVLYTNSVLGTDNPTLDPNTVIVYKQGNNISVNTGNTLINGINVFDINGRQLYSKAGISATETVINSLNVAKQVLIIEIDTVKGKVSKRIVY